MLYVKFAGLKDVEEMMEHRLSSLMGAYITEYVKDRNEKKTGAEKAFKNGLPEYMDNTQLPTRVVQQIHRVTYATGEKEPEGGRNKLKTFFVG